MDLLNLVNQARFLTLNIVGASHFLEIGALATIPSRSFPLGSHRLHSFLHLRGKAPLVKEFRGFDDALKQVQKSLTSNITILDIDI